MGASKLSCIRKATLAITKLVTKKQIPKCVPKPFGGELVVYEHDGQGYPGSVPGSEPHPPPLPPSRRFQAPVECQYQ